MPEVTICLTAWNRPHLMPATLDSLLNQTFRDFELIVSDDSTSDDTGRVCEAYAARDRRIRYFRNTTTLGMPGNLNAAISRASGAFIANLHDGDVFRSDLIEKWRVALLSVPTAAFAFNAYEVADARGASRVAKLPLNGQVPQGAIARNFFDSMTCCVWGTVMARASAYERSGLFDQGYGFISDVDMWLRLARHYDVTYVPEPLIRLAPRDECHPFRTQLWKVAFWTTAIYRRHLTLYEDVLPSISDYRRQLPQRRRRLLVRTMLSCIKHGRWDRAREGLAIWHDADDPALSALGRVFGRRAWKPAWYDDSWWSLGWNAAVGGDVCESL